MKNKLTLPFSLKIIHLQPQPGPVYRLVDERRTEKYLEKGGAAGAIRERLLLLSQT